MKMERKWLTVLLSIVIVLGLATSTLGLSASGRGAVLNVCFAPGGIGVNSTEEKPIIYTAYRVATVEEAGGVYKYTLTEPFEASNVDIDGLLAGEQPADVKSDAYKTLLTELGEYINENAQAIKAADDGVADENKNVRTAPTMTCRINDEDKDGVAQFTNLADGLYLVTTNASAWIDGTRYTPVPFLICIPYVFDGELSDYVTVGLKYSEWKPGGTPTPGGPGPDDGPKDTPQEEPGDTPQEEPDIEILPDDVPLTDMPDDLLPDDLIEIEDEVPLAKLPQTGLLWWPVPLLAAAGIVLVAGGILVKRRAARDA